MSIYLKVLVNLSDVSFTVMYLLLLLHYKSRKVTWLRRK